MDWPDYLRAGLYLLIVLGLIALCAWLLRYYGGMRATPRGKRRLGVVEVASIDPRRRLVLVRRDGIEHLLLLGPAHDLVIESHIKESAVEEPAP